QPLGDLSFVRPSRVVVVVKDAEAHGPTVTPGILPALGLRLPLDRQDGQSAGQGPGASWQLAGRGRGPQRGEPGWQLGEDGIQLDAGQRGADAVVGAVPERQVAWAVAGDVKALGA